MSVICSYSRDIADAICDRLAGGETLNEICRDVNIPPVRTVRRWVIEDRDDFATRYARARELQLEFWGDEIKDLGDSVLGSENNAVVHAAKVAADNRKWLLSKLKPEKYGDRLNVNSTATVRVLDRLSDDELKEQFFKIAQQIQQNHLTTQHDREAAKEKPSRSQ